MNPCARRSLYLASWSPHVRTQIGIQSRAIIVKSAIFLYLMSSIRLHRLLLLCPPNGLAFQSQALVPTSLGMLTAHDVFFQVTNSAEDLTCGDIGHHQPTAPSSDIPRDWSIYVGILFMGRKRRPHERWYLRIIWSAETRIERSGSNGAVSFKGILIRRD